MYERHMLHKTAERYAIADMLRADAEKIRALEADAAWYRWLRVIFVVSAARGGYSDLLRQLVGESTSPHTGPVMDATIDAALAATQSPRSEGDTK